MKTGTEAASFDLTEATDLPVLQDVDQSAENITQGFFSAHSGNNLPIINYPPDQSCRKTRGMSPESHMTVGKIFHNVEY